MHPSEIAASYDTIAHRWLEPHLETNGIPQHQRALQFRATDIVGERAAVALDVGCGCSGRFFRLLEGAGYQVEGLDISERMIALVRERHPHVRFHQADICEWISPRQYDFITAWDSTWHVPLDRSEDVLRKLCAALNPGGILIWTTGGLDEPTEKRDASMGPPVYYSVLGIPQTLQTIAAGGCICRHLEYDQYPELHLCIIAQKRG